MYWQTDRIRSESFILCNDLSLNSKVTNTLQRLTQWRVTLEYSTPIVYSRAVSYFPLFLKTIILKMYILLTQDLLIRILN